MADTVLESMVVRIVGDATHYAQTLQSASGITQNFNIVVNQQAQAVAQAAAATNRAAAAVNEHAALLSRGRSVTASVSTASEQYVARMAELNKLLRANTISQGTFNRAAGAAKAQLDAAGNAVGGVGFQANQAKRGLSILANVAGVAGEEIQTIGMAADGIKIASSATMAMVGAMGVLKTAIAATGIGLLIVAGVALYSWLSKSAAEAKKFREAVAAGFAAAVTGAKTFEAALLDIRIDRTTDAVKRLAERLQTMRRVSATGGLFGGGGGALETEEAFAGRQAAAIDAEVVTLRRNLAQARQSFNDLRGNAQFALLQVEIEIERASSAAADFATTLETSVRGIGLSSTEAQIAEIARQLQRARDLRLGDNVEQLTAALNRARAAADRLRLGELAEQTRTPMERYRKDLAEVNRLLDNARLRRENAGKMLESGAEGADAHAASEALQQASDDIVTLERNTKRLNFALEASGAVMRGWSSGMGNISSILERTRTPLERFRASMEDLAELRTAAEGMRHNTEILGALERQVRLVNLAFEASGPSIRGWTAGIGSLQSIIQETRRPLEQFHAAMQDLDELEAHASMIGDAEALEAIERKRLKLWQDLNKEMGQSQGVLRNSAEAAARIEAQLRRNMDVPSLLRGMPALPAGAGAAAGGAGAAAAAEEAARRAATFAAAGGVARPGGAATAVAVGGMGGPAAAAETADRARIIGHLGTMVNLLTRIANSPGIGPAPGGGLA